MTLSPDPRDALIAEQRQTIELLSRRVEALESQVREVTARLAQNSRNSSKPPSSDPPGVKREKRKGTGRKRGGQPGHEGAERRRLKPNKVVNHKPKLCRCCGEPLFGEDPKAKWFQVFELPEIKPHVTEHRAHSLQCSDCGTVTREVLPARVLRHGFGPRLSAVIGYFTGRCRLSKRQVVEVCEDLFETPISLGAVCAVEQDVSAALAAPVEEAAVAVRTQPVVHMDETGWRENKARAWLWVAVTSVAIVFRVAASRGGSVAKEMLGEDFLGRVVSDRWSGYGWIEAARRQLCWSHIDRDFVGMIERGGVGGEIATPMLDASEKMFKWWSQVQDGRLARSEFQERMVSVRAEVGRLLRDAVARAEKKTAGMCKEILKLESALWTFVDVAGIEPTNNAAERAIRPAVLWRKGSFGNDSARGSQFTGRILSAVATVRLRRGSVLDYLTAACCAARTGRDVPSLLAI